MNADLEDCFADDPAGVAATITAAAAAGAAGASVEDFTRDDGRPIHDIGLATERVAAAVEAARASGLVLTARAENLIHGVRDLDDTIRRLQAYQEAGADVLYAPGLFTDRGRARRRRRPSTGRSTCCCSPAGPTSPALAEAGVARISVGGALAWVAWGAVAEAAGELLASGTPGLRRPRPGRRQGGARRAGLTSSGDARSRPVPSAAVGPACWRTLGCSTVYSTMPMAIIPNGRYVGFSPDSTG